MPFCPNCDYEYKEGVAICPDCGTQLLSKEEYVTSEEWNEENWVVAYIAQQEYEADMLKDNLESAGITAMILSQKDRNFPAPGDFSQIKIMVHKEDLEEAIQFIDKIQKNETTENNEGETE
ncbi:MAG: DUF2007 domain-containing protein [Bacteroidota bacterium]|nr:DUF2007 domain-containing protein [Bacteroidota bacterium]